jgi:hypothetical protein
MNGNGNNPTVLTQDPTCPDTQADANQGSLGQLSYLLRRLVDKLLPPWFYPPVGFQAFDQQSNVATPAIGVSAVILQLLVPTGYDMVGRRISVNIVGPGFVQGSGSLIWSVTIDDVPVRNYAKILTEFGSVQQPRPTDGILARSAQLVKISVSNTAYTSLGTNVVASLGGWFYPSPRRRNNVS